MTLGCKNIIQILTGKCCNFSLTANLILSSLLMLEKCFELDVCMA